MEPFAVPQDLWGLQEQIRQLKVTQYEHAERLSNHDDRIGKLERRQDDSRIRSLWSTPSPFPAPLSTYSHPEPSSPPRADEFAGFDDQQNLVLSGLQLDEVDVPRRGASRANSVRFDDSATTNHWIHDPTGPNDYFQHRNHEGVGGYPMAERSLSHKSDQRSDERQSSLRSFGYTSPSSEDESGLPFALSAQSSGMLDCSLHRPSSPSSGPTPAIIRCIPDNSFEVVLHAVVCTGSAKSLIDMSVLNRIGLEGHVFKDTNQEPKIELAIWLPDAIIQQHSRVSGQNMVPRLTVSFSVTSSRKASMQDGDIDIFLGSDVMSTHMGDVLFSQSKLLLYVDDGRKVYVPFIRPESNVSFSDICTAHAGSGIFEGATKQPAALQGEAPILRNGSAESTTASSAVEPTHSHVALSSPKPISGRQASVIRDEGNETSPTFASPPVNNIGSRPGKGYRRWESFGGSSSGPTNAQDHMENGPSSADGERVTGNKSESDGITRGRSLTNPQAAGVGTGGMKLPAGSVWDTARKGSLSYSSAQKEGSTSSGGSKSVRGSSRGMKVLRTSKSSSLSEARANHQSSASTNSATLGQPNASPRPNTPASATGSRSNKSGHSRVNSNEGGSSAFKVPLVKTKSSNVVGGATAFHWMAPKASASE